MALRLSAKVLLSLLAFLGALVVVAPIIGTVATYFRLPFSWPALVLCAVGAASLTPTLVAALSGRSSRSLLPLVLLIVVFIGVFRGYAPFLMVKQDPGVYQFKALNLVNFGSMARPMPMLAGLIKSGQLDLTPFRGYASIENGMQFDGERLNGDFYDGGASFSACLGSLWRPLVFFAPLILALTGLCLLYLLIERIVPDSWAAVALTMCLMLSPAFGWFGRGPYGENAAFVVFLLALLLFSDSDAQSPRQFLATSLTLLGACFLRIEYVLMVMAGVGLFTCMSLARGTAFLILSVLAIHVASSAYPIYYEMNFAMFFVRYDVQILVAIWGVGVLVHMLRIEPRRWLASQPAGLLLTGFFFVMLLCMYRNDLPERFYEIAIIHGTPMRTFNEEILDRLFTVFPAMILVVGYLAVGGLLQKADLAWPGRLFLAALLVPFSYALYRSYNSPQMYWVLRRYVYLVLPSALLGFAFFVNCVPKRERRILLAASLLLAINIFWDARQTVQYEGLDEDVRRFVGRFDERKYILLYPPRLRYAVSALVSYGKYDFLPVGDVRLLETVVAGAPADKALVYLTDTPVVGLKPKRAEFSYSEMPEDFFTLPRRTDAQHVVLFAHRAKAMLKAVREGRAAL